MSFLLHHLKYIVIKITVKILMSFLLHHLKYIVIKITVTILMSFLLHHLEYIVIKKICKLKKINDEGIDFEETSESSQVNNNSEKEHISFYSRKDAAVSPFKGFLLTESEFQAKVMKYLIKQDQRLENIEKVLLNLTSSLVGVNKKVSQISNLEDLHNLQERIANEEEFNKLVFALSSAGGKDVKDVVKNIMEKCSNEG
ncbi:uncharacterized protein LOC124810629 isoform X5 [Hydra vulgaris]